MNSPVDRYVKEPFREGLRGPLENEDSFWREAGRQFRETVDYHRDQEFEESHGVSEVTEYTLPELMGEVMGGGLC